MPYVTRANSMQNCLSASRIFHIASVVNTAGRRLTYPRRLDGFWWCREMMNAHSRELAFSGDWSSERDVPVDRASIHFQHKRSAPVHGYRCELGNSLVSNTHIWCAC